MARCPSARPKTAKTKTFQPQRCGLISFSVIARDSFKLQKDTDTVFQIKTLAAVGFLEQALYSLGSRNQIIHFGYLASREYLPAVERRNPFAKSVEELLDLINSKASALGRVDDGQVVQDTGLLTALPADALGVRE